MHKRIICLALLLCLITCGCAKAQIPTEQAGIVTTTMQLYSLTEKILSGSEAQKTVPLSCVISEPVSCLHDYTLSVRQMKQIEGSAVLITVGLGFEDFMQDALSSADAVRICCADGISALPGDETEFDPHIWLRPENAAKMAKTVADALSQLYPEDAGIFSENAAAYAAQMDELQACGERELADLSCRKLVTFHDGFSYFADAFDLEIAASMEIEAGSEPSAKDLEQIIHLIRAENIPAIFTEVNGTNDAAELVAAETGAKIFTLDMGLSGGDAIRHNIETVKEALR